MNAQTPNGESPGGSDFAALWSSDSVTRSFGATGTGLPADLPFLFSEGQRLGGYVVVRPIGKGGMGQVYEAEEIESGRRVAVKILSRGLGDDEERARFLREGQLAASLSHPNCVYVFGTSEVQGFPVIAMELAPAGTLKDLVVPGVPVRVAAAVDAILQVIVGLEAAAGLGILHRDVKPSNCFVDHDGRVMVGDFGLSITTAARDHETVVLSATILGTPGFASPEQLRGDALDVRSDIYSVGATLYYLLCGAAPFEDPHIMSLLTRVASEPAPSISVVRPDVPARLASLVAKCLAKRPADRYGNYAALAAALEPFRSVTLTPASLGRRFLAGWVDSNCAALPLLPFNMFIGSRLLDLQHRGEAALLAIPTVVAALVYYTILEGRFGCGVGKAVFNLRLVDGARGAPGMRRGFLRAFIFIVPAQVVTQGAGYLMVRWATATGTLAGNPAVAALGIGSVLLSLVCVAILFLTARRANGWAAMHDLLTGTRVVLRPRAIEARQVLQRSSRAMPSLADGASRIGPYVVSDAVGAQATGVAAPVVVDGFDDRLRRGVWIERLPPGTPPVPAWRRDLGRPGRARWISGRRAGPDCWDAYEAIEGQLLVEAACTPQPWARVRHWLAELAEEVAAGSRDGSLPVLATDRIWAGADDRVRVLDWPGPGAYGTRALRVDAVAAPADAQRFLYAVAVGALRGVEPGVACDQPPLTALPLPARTLLSNLRVAAFPTVDAAAAAASAILREPASVARRRRLLQLAACAVIPIMMAVSVFTAIKLQMRSQTADPQAFALTVCLKELAEYERKGTLTPLEQQQRESIEVYVAAHLRAEAEGTASYARALPGVTAIQRDYAMAERALANHPQPTPEQVRNADEVVAGLLESSSRGLSAINTPVILWGVVAFIAGGAATAVALLGLIGAVAARGGVTLRLFGAALVTADGRDASRMRALVRACIAWSPLALWFLMMRYGPSVQRATVSVAMLYTLALALLIAGAVWAWLHPSRGIQDRLAGTWIVPR